MIRAAALIPLIVCLGGCVSDGPKRERPPTGIRPIDPAPSQIVINMKDFADTDQNGYLDTAVATIYIFSSGYALPIDTSGSFVFSLSDPVGRVIAEWSVSPRQASACRIKTQVGPGFAFNLDLRPLGAERTPGPDAMMSGLFVDSKDRSVRSGQLAVTVGRAR